MGTDYAEKERIFISGLESGTGRTLDAWMQAITDAGLTQRNDIIDWLRLNGFTFSNASWLERIHHNGGRLVYASGEDATGGTVQVAARVASQSIATPRLLPRSDIAPATAANDADFSAAAPVIANPDLAAAFFNAAVSDVLAAAKGLRPLAALALLEIGAMIPETVLDADGAVVLLSGPRPFMALLPGAKVLRFYGDFGTSGDGRIARAEAVMKIAGKAAPPFRSVLVLTDARLVDSTFRDLVRAAHARAHT